MKLVFANLLTEGGPLFMFPILLMLLACIILAIMALVKSNRREKFTHLIKHLGLLAMAWGFLGFFFSLIGVFDAIESLDGKTSHSILAGGHKMGLLSPSFGIFTFLIARIGLLLMNIFKN